MNLFDLGQLSLAFHSICTEWIIHFVKDNWDKCRKCSELTSQFESVTFQTMKKDIPCF